MPKTTTYHGWELPIPYNVSAEDTDYWAIILDDWITSDLSNQVIRQGTQSQRPAPAVTGRLYLAVDGPTLYRDTGSAWIAIAGRNLQGTALTGVGGITMEGSIALNGSDLTDAGTVSGATGSFSTTATGSLAIGTGGGTIEGTEIATVDDVSDGGGGVERTVTPVTGAYTASNGEVVLADASGGALDVTLPAAANGVSASVKKTDETTNAVGIVTPGSEQVENQTSLSITRATATRTLVSDGTDYYVL